MNIFQKMFGGTLNRAPWWFYWIVGNLTILYAYHHLPSSSVGFTSYDLFILVLGLGAILMHLIVTSKRLRQAGFSPYLCLLEFIPYLGSFALLVLAGCFPPKYQEHNVD